MSRANSDQAGEARLRRACFTVAAGLALSAAALPGALLASQLPATASTASGTHIGGSPVSVAFTSMNPTTATAKATITVTGTVTNVSKESITDLSVQLDASSQPFGSVSALTAYLARPYQLPGQPVTGQHIISATALRPGQSVPWSLSFRASKAGMTAFGVYPLTAQVNADVQGSLGASAPLNYAYTFLPYVPAKHSRFASSVPARRQIAWVWPLIDAPVTALPGKRVCSGPQIAALRASLAPAGRLDGLLAAGSRYGGRDQLTWAVDPALLHDAHSLAGCNGPQAAAAASWLAALRQATKGQPLFATPYADVELSLISQHHSSDVDEAFAIGRKIATQILHRRDLTPAAGNAPAGASPPVSGVAWPPTGTAVYATVENLAADDGIQTVLLDGSWAAAGSRTAFLTANGVTGFAHVLLYSDALSKTLGTGATGPGAAFGTSQDFLAETALLAQQDPGAAIVVAPPRRWHPTAGLASDVLADTASAPWLQPVPLASLDVHVTSRHALPSSGAGAGFGRQVLRKLDVIDTEIAQLDSIQNTENFYLYSTALESSAWHSPAMTRRRQLAQLEPLRNYLRLQEGGVSLVVGTRVTLGGLKGPVPVSIDNRLDYPVTVRLGVHWDQPPGGGLHVYPPLGLITVPAGGLQQVKIRIEAAQVGSTTIKLWLVSRASRLLPGTSPVSVTVQATQFGNLAMIILASVLGLFVLGSAIRGARRRDPVGPDNAGDLGHPDEDAEHGSDEAPGTDTVIPERTGLGTAGTSGL